MDSLKCILNLINFTLLTFQLLYTLNSTLLFNFYFSIFRFQFSIPETQQLHIVYFYGVIDTSLPNIPNS